MSDYPRISENIRECPRMSENVPAAPRRGRSIDGWTRRCARDMARESTSLLTGEDARGRGRARVIFVAAVVAIVGTACVTLTLGAFPGTSLGARFARRGVTIHRKSGKIELLHPTSDTCAPECDGLVSKSAGTYAYLDPTCKFDSFGCGSGRLSNCRSCQTEPYHKHGKKKWHYVQCPTCVCTKHDTTGCNLCVSKYKYYRFNVKTTRYVDGYVNVDGGGCAPPDITQFAEIKLYTGTGSTLITLDQSQSTVLGGDQNLCRSDQGPNAATDGVMATKMCDLRTISEPGGLNFVFAAQEPTLFTHYEIFTAEDCPGRDPTSWTLYGSTVSNQGPWVEFSSHRADPPTSRHTSYGVMQVC